MIACLSTEYDNAKSFYNKAIVEIVNNDIILYSYSQLVLIVNDGKVASFPMEKEKLSNTTLRHIREFLKQEIDYDKKWTKKEILELKESLN